MKQISPFPYISGHVRRYLLEHPDVVEALGGGRIGTGPVPSPLRDIYVRVSVTGQSGSTPRRRQLIVQVTPWLPADPGGAVDDPMVRIWNVATVIGQALSLARNEIIDSSTAWSAEWIEGPTELYDEQRGADAALLFTPVAFNVTVSHKNT